MNMKRILGIAILVVGVVLLFVSNYIKGQVEEGKMKISDAEKKVGVANSLFSLSPVAKEITQGSMEGANRKIEAGKGDVAYYEKLAGQLKVGGYVLILAGAVVFLIGRKRH